MPQITWKNIDALDFRDSNNLRTTGQEQAIKAADKLVALGEKQRELNIAADEEQKLKNLAEVQRNSFTAGTVQGVTDQIEAVDFSQLSGEGAVQAITSAQKQQELYQKQELQAIGIDSSKLLYRDQEKNQEIDYKQKQGKLNYQNLVNKFYAPQAIATIDKTVAGTNTLNTGIERTKQQIQQSGELFPGVLELQGQAITGGTTRNEQASYNLALDKQYRAQERQLNINTIDKNNTLLDQRVAVGESNAVYNDATAKVAFNTLQASLTGKHLSNQTTSITNQGLGSRLSAQLTSLQNEAKASGVRLHYLPQEKRLGLVKSMLNNAGISLDNNKKSVNLQTLSEKNKEELRRMVLGNDYQETTNSGQKTLQNLAISAGKLGIQSKQFNNLLLALDLKNRPTKIRNENRDADASYRQKEAVTANSKARLPGIQAQSATAGSNYRVTQATEKEKIEASKQKLIASSATSRNTTKEATAVAGRVGEAAQVKQDSSIQVDKQVGKLVNATGNLKVDNAVASERVKQVETRKRAQVLKEFFDNTSDRTELRKAKVKTDLAKLENETQKAKQGTVTDRATFLQKFENSLSTETVKKVELQLKKQLTENKITVSDATFDRYLKDTLGKLDNSISGNTLEAKQNKIKGRVLDRTADVKVNTGVVSARNKEQKVVYDNLTGREQIGQFSTKAKIRKEKTEYEGKVTQLTNKVFDATKEAQYKTGVATQKQKSNVAATKLVESVSDAGQAEDKAQKKKELQQLKHNLAIEKGTTELEVLKATKQYRVTTSKATAKSDSKKALHNLSVLRDVFTSDKSNKKGDILASKNRQKMNNLLFNSYASGTKGKTARVKLAKIMAAKKGNILAGATRKPLTHKEQVQEVKSKHKATLYNSLTNLVSSPVTREFVSRIANNPKLSDEQKVKRVTAIMFKHSKQDPTGLKSLKEATRVDPDVAKFLQTEGLRAMNAVRRKVILPDKEGELVTTLFHSKTPGEIRENISSDVRGLADKMIREYNTNGTITVGGKVYEIGNVSTLRGVMTAGVLDRKEGWSTLGRAWREITSYDTTLFERNVKNNLDLLNKNLQKVIKDESKTLRNIHRVVSRLRSSKRKNSLSTKVTNPARILTVQ